MIFPITSTPPTRLNRNILECKFHLLQKVVSSHIGLNRNILECKLSSIESAESLTEVLIETYWNVNMVLGEVSDEKLICLNRNILECKSVILVFKFPGVILVLIETYWNVNFGADVVEMRIRSLNRNILECKFGCKALRKIRPYKS